jgi:hypothetical protein
MTSNKLIFYLNRIIILSSILAFILSMIGIVNPGIPFGPYLSFVLVAVFFTIVYTIFIINFLQRTPSTLTISILGFPNAGKTVFLTVLFEELRSIQQFNHFIFSAYGDETIERTLKDIKLLSTGQWLPPTPITGLFYYRAQVFEKVGMINKRFMIEIPDYAGENIKEFDVNNDKWLHKTPYFENVVQSHAVLLAIDSEKVLESKNFDLIEMENSFIAAIQKLREKKGVDFERKIKAPVALLFMKYDLVKHTPNPLLDKDKLGDLLVHMHAREDKEVLEHKLPRLMEVCRRGCSNFDTFIVSSVGEIDTKGRPPEHLRPFGVVDPLLWILKKV